MPKLTHTGNEGTRIQDSNAVWMGLVAQTNIRQQVITVGVTALPLPTIPLTDRKNIVIFNNSTGGQIVYIGDSTVTTSDGLPLYPRASIKIDIIDNIKIYAISSAAGADVRVLEGS